MISASMPGRLGNDATTQSLSSGTQIVKFSIAVKVGRDNTEWVNCVMWGERGMKLLPHLKKGTQVWVAGEMGVNRYQSKSGEDKASLDLNVQSFEFVGSKPSDDRQQASSPVDDGLGDIPF